MKDPILIGGFYRSGTTLLRRLLDAHSRIHCPPEIKFFPDFYGDWSADPLAHVRFFKTLRSTGLPAEELLDVFGRAYVETRKKAARRAGKRRWADKNPENSLYLDGWTRLLGRRFLFVHVVRHPLDALASLQEAGFEKTVPGNWKERIALYGRFIESARAFSSQNPRRSLVVRYEDLVGRPEEALKTLLRPLGESFEPRILTDFASKKRGEGLGDPKAGRAATIHTRSVGRWKKDLTSLQIEDARSALTSAFSSWGYQL